jgi:hypothetical protein
MKTKALWLSAIALAVVCAWTVYNYVSGAVPKSLIGVQTGAVVFAESHLPVLHWGSLNQFGDMALKIKSQHFFDLTTAQIEQTVRYNGLRYTQIQAGLFLVVLNNEQIFVMTDPFEPENLEVTQAVDFQSDWVVLQRSSLLPENWPEPKQGWVVLGAQISEKLESHSLESHKPVVRPERGGTVWLEKTLESDWVIIKP